MSDLRRRSWEPPGETLVLAALAVLALLLFAFTSVAARSFHAHREQLGEEWFRRGVAHLEQARPELAAGDFRNALTYDRENRLYSLRLAQSLAAIGRIQQAEAYLLSLWERAPGDGTINLELARLAARDGRVDVAHGYFHNAVYGVWERDAEQQRRRVRWEMIDFLLVRGRRHEAVAELASLAGDLPGDDLESRARLGQLYARAGAHENALHEYLAALKIDSNNPIALAGAGESAFELGRFALAERYLARAQRRDAKDPRVDSRLEIARAAQVLDPFAYRLPAAERARRAATALALTLERLRACADEKGEPPDERAESPLRAQYRAGVELRPRATPARMRRDESALDAVMEFVFRSQQLAAQECGAGSAADQALLLLEKRPAAE
jgi:tetratricopeptide (TPR) repeat protein